MPIIDITRTLSPSIAVWPGDAPFEITGLTRIQDGAASNVTTLTMSAHTGTHADAARHIQDGATPLDEEALLPFWGRAQVIEIDQLMGPITFESIEKRKIDLSAAPRLLLKTKASDQPLDQFDPSYVWPDAGLLEAFAEAGGVLIGTDAPSIDPFDSQILAGHHMTLKHGLAIVEGLMLKGVTPGFYEFVGLPLKIEHGDGSPIRAALKPL